MTDSPPPGSNAQDRVSQRLEELALAHLDLSATRLRSDALLGEDLGIDSLAAIELGMVVEDEFGISLPDDVIADLHTYGDLVAAVRERAAAVDRA